MKNILHLFKRDVQNVSRSVIGLVVVMGLIIVPCLYAWFNIAGSWDPYGNTGNLKIAVVNTDEGYESDLIPVEVNVGENVTATLRGNESFDWVVLNNREKAIEGVKSGAYYAAVVIPKTFSADMMTLFSTDVKHADIEFYENQKANAIAQIVTEKGSSAVQSQVNKTFTETITTIGLKTVSSLLDYMSTDQVGNFIANLSSTLGDSIEDLRDVRANASSLAGILSSTSDSLTSASGMLKQTGTVDESTKQLMEHVKSGISDSKEALKDANDAINAAIDGSAGSFDNVSAELAKAFDAANQHVDLTVSQLNDAAAALNTRADDIDATADQLRSFADQVTDEKLQDSLKSVATSLSRIAVEYRNNAKDLTATAKSLSDSMAEVNKSRAEVDQAIADAKAGISGAKTDYDSTFSAKAKELKKTISGVLDSLNGISNDLDSAVAGLTDASGSLAKGLSKAAKLVNKASDQLGEASDKISAFKDELDGALMSDDLATIKTMIGNDPEGLAVSLSGALDRKPVYPIRNYGSAMAPFYTILSLWVGSIVLAAMMKVSVDDELINELIPVRLHEIYLGRYLFFGGLALLQATLVCAGDILFFGIQCDDPLQFVLAGWVASLVFSNIVYTLTVSFGDIGKALAVVLLVMVIGINALSGPLHGGANEAVLRQLKAIRDSGKTVKEFVEDAKAEGHRISGLGHRVYKSYDPRAAIARLYLEKIIAREDTRKLPADERALFDVAVELEDIALNDEYFVSRHLYPNVDFYTGLIYRAIGFDPAMFTTLFALGRIPGWIAQYREMLADPNTKIGRPRQVYTGYTERDYVPMDQRH